MKIAVDAMGGDRAPAEIVRGVVDAIEAGHVRAGDVILVGISENLASYGAEFPVLRDVPIEHAPDVVGMSDSAAGSIRAKPNSSIQVALRLVQQGQAGAFVSAGNTGAVVASAASLLGRLPGVRRPGIAVSFQSASGPVTILDVGANVHCKPLHLFQYGLMADVFSRDVLKVPAPRIALLNIGEEEEKGNALVRETRELFENSPLNFVGNIEGNQLLAGDCNVVVCEGFVGNVVLKVVEGVGHFLQTMLREHLKALDTGAAEVSRPLRGFLAKLDYAEYGGAPLLGVNGLVMIMHGRSDRRAMANALRVSRQFIEANVNGHISRALAQHFGAPSGGLESPS